MLLLDFDEFGMDLTLLKDGISYMLSLGVVFFFENQTQAAILYDFVMNFHSPQRNLETRQVVHCDCHMKWTH